MFESYSEFIPRDRLKYAAVVVLAIILVLIVIQLKCRTREDVEEIINNSPVLIEHDNYCSSLPLQEDFTLRFRAVGGNSYTLSISYYYYSKLPFSSVASFFRQRLETNGWKMTSLYAEDMTAVGKHISFEKDDYRISVGTVADPGATFALDCSKVIR
jgi:hypothetical protein